MAESTLSLKLAELKSEIGSFLGYGRGNENGEADAAWTTPQLADIVSCLKSGLRQFYFPRPETKGGTIYEWSFLKPTAEIVVASGQAEVVLPDDFGGFDGEVLVTGDNRVCIRLPLSGMVRVKEIEQSGATGPPQYAEVEPVKGTTAAAGQRFKLRLWPTTDQAYTLKARYYVNPDWLTDASPWAYGGAMHAETIRAACLMAAEEFKNDEVGVWARKFDERLAASMAYDRRNKPAHLGYNGDRSDGRALRSRASRWDNVVTYEGTEYA